MSVKNNSRADEIYFLYVCSLHLCYSHPGDGLLPIAFRIFRPVRAHVHLGGEELQCHMEDDCLPSLLELQHVASMVPQGSRDLESAHLVLVSAHLLEPHHAHLCLATSGATGLNAGRRPLGPILVERVVWSWTHRRWQTQGFRP